MQTFKRFVYRISDMAANVATVLLLIMFAVNCIDIIGSKFFNRPFQGVVEVTGYLMAVLIPTAAALVFLNDQHIRIEILTEKLPDQVKRAIDRMISLVMFLLLSTISWKMFQYGMSRHGYGEYSDTLHFPFYYIIYLVSLGFIPFCVALLQDFLSRSKE